MTLDESEAARSVIIRATDAMNNVATAVAEIEAVRADRVTAVRVSTGERPSRTGCDLSDASGLAA